MTRHGLRKSTETAGKSAVQSTEIERVIAAIIVPCLMPIGDGEKVTVATFDQFGIPLARKFVAELSKHGFDIVNIHLPKEG